MRILALLCSPVLVGGVFHLGMKAGLRAAVRVARADPATWAKIVAGQRRS